MQTDRTTTTTPELPDDPKKINRDGFARRLRLLAEHCPEMGGQIAALIADVDRILSTSDGTGELLEMRADFEERTGRRVSLDWLVCGEGAYADGEPRRMFQAEEPDPAIPAVRRWIAAQERACAHVPRGEADWLDDPPAQAIEAEAEAAFRDILSTPPTTPAGFALALAALAYSEHSTGFSATFRDAPSWGVTAGRPVEKLIGALWRSPAAAELFGRIET